MACLPLVKSNFTVASTLLAKRLWISSVPVCHSLRSFRHLITISHNGTLVHVDDRTFMLQTVGHQHLYGRYHTGSQAKPLASIPQIDLDLDNAVVPEEKNTVDTSEILQNLSPEEEKKLKLIKLEFDVHKEINGQVPEEMTDENWLHALSLEKTQRFKYYRFLRKKELFRKQKKQKQKLAQVAEQQQQQMQESTKEYEEDDRKVSKNTFSLIIRDSTMNVVGSSRLARAMLFGQPLVFDMGYEQFMRPQDCQSLVKQLCESYSINRFHVDPFHLIFTSLDPSGMILSKLKHQHLCGQNFLGTMTDKSYLDLYPHKNLVYLTPHARDELQQVNYDDVYIVGGFVDKVSEKPVSLARAKEQGIRTAKFPLDKYLLWGMGKKSLPINQVVAIMLEQRESKDWPKALQHIPLRKLKRDI